MKMNKKNMIITIFLLFSVRNTQTMEKENVFPFNQLPLELQREVLVIALNNEINNLPESYKSIDIAAQKIKNFALINKAFNEAINQT